MLLELMDEATRRFVLALLSTDQVNTQANAPRMLGDSSSGAAYHALADELIKNACGTHSLGLIYEFLRRTHGTPETARAEFVNFLSGQWSPAWVEAAKRAIAEERWPSAQKRRVFLLISG